MKQGFQYHASAIGVAAEITHPIEHQLEALAPSVLAPTGGYSSNRVENFRLEEILSFQAAYTQVAGFFVEKNGEQSWDTLITSTVEGLNILSVVTADRIVARISSRHRLQDREASILPLGSHIEGLRIAGIPIDIKWNVERYSQWDTATKVEEGYQTNFDRFGDLFDEENRIGKRETLPEILRSFFPGSHCEPRKAITRDCGPIAASLVAKLNIGSSYLQAHGHTIHVPQFGNVVLGQYVMNGNARQITMLQVHPECAVGVAVVAGGGQTDGQPVPPIPRKP